MAEPGGRVYRPVIRGLYRVLNVVMRAVCDALDFLVLVARRTFLQDSRPRRHRSPRSAMIHAMTHGGQRTEQEAADRLGTILDTLRRMEGSLSLCPADGLPGIVHRPGVHPAVRLLRQNRSGSRAEWRTHFFYFILFLSFLFPLFETRTEEAQRGETGATKGGPDAANAGGGPRAASGYRRPPHEERAPSAFPRWTRVPPSWTSCSIFPRSA